MNSGWQGHTCGRHGTSATSDCGSVGSVLRVTAIPKGGTWVVMDGLSSRWQRRREGMDQSQPPAMVPLTVSEQVTVMVDPAKVWHLVWDPATSPLVLDHVVTAFTMPGTPPGQVGEMQIHVIACQDGRLIASIVEVVELGPGYRAVTRARSADPPATATTLVLPLDQGGCVLRYRIDQLVSAETVNVVREEYRGLARTYLSRVRELAQTSEQHRSASRATSHGSPHDREATP